MNTMMSIAAELIKGGHQVDFYVRKDGGILIRRIDNEYFTAAKGNARAREMVGVKISEARAAQLKFATATRRELRTPSLKKIQIPDPIMEEYARVKKLWNKAFKAKGGKPHPAGYFTRSRIKKALRDYDPEEALRRIGEAEKYATGIAYSKNAQHLADYILTTGVQLNSQELQKLAADILANAYAIKEEWIQPAYAALYKLNEGQDPKNVASKVRRILRLA